MRHLPHCPPFGLNEGTTLPVEGRARKWSETGSCLRHAPFDVMPMGIDSLLFIERHRFETRPKAYVAKLTPMPFHEARQRLVTRTSPAVD
jgi:hypothetical protein